MVLASDGDTLQKLQDTFADRLEEGFGETVFELGYENNGDSMNLSLDDWNKAYARVVEAAKRVRADCDLLLTHNVGGDKEAPAPAQPTSKSKGCNGKILIRQVPNRIEDVIETRIAVVGNGE
jgi:GTPase